MSKYIVFRTDFLDADFVVGEVVNTNRGEISIQDPVAFFFLNPGELGIFRLMPFTKAGIPTKFLQKSILISSEPDDSLIELYHDFLKNVSEIIQEEARILQAALKSGKPKLTPKTKKNTSLH
jgi:hypothetical protein